MSRPALLLVSVIVIIASAAIVGWSFFGLGTSSSPSPQSNQKAVKQSTQSGQVNKGFPQIPVSIKNPAVKQVFVTYKFTGTIKETQGPASKMQLITDIVGSKIPKLFVNPKTIVNKVENGKKTKASLSDLTPGKKVEITYIYRLKKKSWDGYATSVDIITKSTASAFTN